MLLPPHRCPAKPNAERHTTPNPVTGLGEHNPDSGTKSAPVVHGTLSCKI